MCGIAGIIQKKALPDPDPKTAGALLRALRHRGPDGSGTFAAPGFLAVHTRLAIVDRAGGAQPMTLEDGRLGIVYNGEIYNHLELRRELAAKGHAFATSSDTEVALRMYAEFGQEAFTRLEGMFAMCLWDLRGPEPVYWLARDPVGVKPLYVYEDAERIVFCSELRPLLAMPGLDLALNPEGLAAYLYYRYCPGERTFFKNIRRVEAGFAWRCQAGRLLRLRYWDVPFAAPPADISLEEAREELVRLLRESVSSMLMSEVPVGMLLSGGLDSSAIAVMLRELGAPMKAYCIGFPQMNEFAYARHLADSCGLDLTTVETTPEEIAAVFPDVIAAQDEPIADPASFPLHLLGRHMRDKVTVVLSGEGSDEIFCGYDKYLQTLRKKENAHRQYRIFLENSQCDPEGPDLVRPRVPAARMRGYAAYFMEQPVMNGMLCHDLKTWLPENLMMKADKILMAHSLEGRFPYLDRRVLAFALGLPEELRCFGGIGKYVLRKSMDEFLPQSILERRKEGFSVPVPQILGLLHGGLPALLADLARSPLAEALDLRAAADFLAGDGSRSGAGALRQWTLLILLSWFRAFKDGSLFATRPEATPEARRA